MTQHGVDVVPEIFQPIEPGHRNGWQPEKEYNLFSSTVPVGHVLSNKMLRAIIAKQYKIRLLIEREDRCTQRIKICVLRKKGNIFSS